MRIVGNIPNPIMKITIFQMETRFSVKFEIGSMEQVYRIRKSDRFQSAQQVKEFIDPEFQQKVLEEFKNMGAIMKSALSN